jgi:predicted O-methyltransferase YrrM
MFDYTPSPELGQYLRSVSVREPDVLRRLREETAAYPNASMQVSPELGQFLAFLVRMLKARRCLEIGVFTGYSSTIVAMNLPADGQLVACDRNEEWTSVACRYWREAKVDRKVILRLGPALRSLDALLEAGEAGSFDFAFIDADKSNYLNYYERVLRLLRRGGVMAVDNVLWKGSVIDASNRDPDTVAIREFNAKLVGDDRIFLSMLPLRDGLTLAMKK